jgi:hypothetical protein
VKISTTSRKSRPLPIAIIEERIYGIRGQKVMLSSHLAELYGVEARVLTQAVKRNSQRFPADFLFRLSPEEFAALRSQIVTLEKGRGRYPKYPPYAFTEQGVAMLSSVLRSKRAVEVNIAIMRAFVRLRQLLDTNDEFRLKLQNLERKLDSHDVQITVIAQAVRELRQLMPGLEPKPKRPIGFRPK